jgi:hypothetical protein
VPLRRAFRDIGRGNREKARRDGERNESVVTEFFEGSWGRERQAHHDNADASKKMKRSKRLARARQTT